MASSCRQGLIVPYSLSTPTDKQDGPATSGISPSARILHCIAVGRRVLAIVTANSETVWNIPTR